jgi:hypothetical protein
MNIHRGGVLGDGGCGGSGDEKKESVNLIHNITQGGGDCILRCGNQDLTLQTL